MSRHGYLFLCVFIFLAGCTSTAHNAKTVGPHAPGESQKDVISAMESVLGNVAGKPVSQKDLEKLNRAIQKDPEAKSAVQTITNSLRAEQVVKFCPIDGERYSPKFENCPVHHVPLKTLAP